MYSRFFFSLFLVFGSLTVICLGVDFLECILFYFLECIFSALESLSSFMSVDKFERFSAIILNIFQPHPFSALLLDADEINVRSFLYSHRSQRISSFLF